MSATASSDPRHSRLQRWLLPGVIGTEDARRDAHGGTRAGRSARDWVVDAVLCTFAVLIGAGGLLATQPLVGTSVSILDGVVGLPCCGLIWVRRRHPLAVGVVAVGCSLVSKAAGGAAVVALLTVAVHCPPRRTLQLAALSAVAGVTTAAIYTHRSSFDLGALGFWLVVTIAAVGLGSFVRARRELVLSLRERARRAEEERDLRVREARLAERARIAREMHDVLAHRISLLSVHAGALEFNPGAPPEEIARAAGIIRVSARAAQEELREVIGVLRAGAEGEALQPPQPTIADLPRLVEESRAAGMDVSFRETLAAAPLSPILGRTVYRVVQEGLTNARKHAAGQVVTITLRGGPETGLTVEVVNRPWVGRAADPGPRAETGGAAGVGATAAPGADEVGAHVGSGMGLVGLAERVSLVGGRLRGEPVLPGGFRLLATLPWSDLDGEEEVTGG